MLAPMSRLRAPQMLKGCPMTSLRTSPIAHAEVKLGSDGGGLVFVPDKLTVKAGESVTFKNNVGFPHNVVFDEDAVPEGVDAAAKEQGHEIKGKKNVTVKKADVKQGKIYVGKLPDSGIGEDEIREHFAQFGTIAEVIRPIDKSKDNEPKNFCFVTFEKERVAKKLIEEGTCTIGEHTMQIKQVTPNPRDPAARGGRGGQAPCAPTRVPRGARRRRGMESRAPGLRGRRGQVDIRGGLLGH